MSDETTSTPSQGVHVLLGFMTSVGSALLHLGLAPVVMSLQIDFLNIIGGFSIFVTPILIGVIVRNKTGWTGFLPGIVMGVLMSVVIPCSAIYIFCSSMRF